MNLSKHRLAAFAGAAAIAAAMAAGGAAYASGPATAVSAASGPDPSAALAFPGSLTATCLPMMREYRAMARMDEQMMRGAPDNGRMSRRMTGGGVTSMMGGGLRGHYGTCRFVTAGR